jgi:Rhomboid family
MFLHGSWDHILGNMLFLAIFGKNVEDAFGSLGYLAFYFAGGFFAMMTQMAMTLLFGGASDAQTPNLGASGAIAAVLGAYFVLYPGSRITTWVFFFIVRIPAWFFLGGWFLYQLTRPTSGCSARRRTAAVSRSSPMLAASSLASSSPWCSSARGGSPHKAALPSCAPPTERQDRGGIAGTAGDSRTAPARSSGGYGSRAFGTTTPCRRAHPPTVEVVSEDDADQPERCAPRS